MSRGSNNYAVLLEEFPRPAIAPLTFFILKPKPIVNPVYLTWCLNQETVKAKLNEIRTGAGTPMIPRQEFSEIIIPLPPLDVQKENCQSCRSPNQRKGLVATTHRRDRTSEPDYRIADLVPFD